MSGREQDGQSAVPLAKAATLLGLTSDALRMRIRRGKAKGFKRGRQVYVWLPEDSLKTPTAAAAPRRARGSPPEPAPAPAPRGHLPMLVEIQKDEIARLIQETERLNARLDRHLDEARDLRQMLQREQVLRQQEQSLRQDIQRLLDRLIAYPALLGPRLAAARPETAPPAVPRPPPTPGPDPGPSPGPGPGPSGENLDLAEMLKEIGQSLRELEARGQAGPGVAPGKPNGGEEES